MAEIAQERLKDEGRLLCHPRPSSLGCLDVDSSPSARVNLGRIVKYRSRLSGPLADRIDMQVTLTPVPLVDLHTNIMAESSTAIRSRVEAARSVQRLRYAATRGVTCNAHASGRWLLTRGQLAADARRLLVEGAESLHLSARAYHRVLRVARTIADLSQSEPVTSEHVCEALRYRQR